MERVLLTRGNWEAKQYDPKLPDNALPNTDGEWFPALVPGAIQYDLAALGKLENPYASTKAALDAAWVAKSDWVYRTGFETPSKAEKAETILLRFSGVDTYAEVWLNGNLLGKTANAYRTYDFPVKPSLLAAGVKNTLLVRVKAHGRMITSKIYETEKHLNNGNSVEGLLGKSLIRRYQRSFFAGSSLLNLGTGVLGIGIVREVSLVLYSGAYITGCCFKTVSVTGDEARCKILLSVKNAKGSSRVKIHIDSPSREEAGGKIPGSSANGSTGGSANGSVYNAEFPVNSGDREIPFTIDYPELWQPRGYGKPNLYTLTVKVEQNGKTTDEVTQRIGIRTSEIITRDERGRKTFYLKINGRKVMVHGQNHIPLDYIKSYGSREEYRRVFDMLDNQYVNMVRIWGGGVIEDDYFYSECDRRGIMLFQDFFLHSNQYPEYDSDWKKEFLAESEEMLVQIRSHPCLCVICGGNETREGWDCWGWQQSTSRFNGEKLITKDLPDISAKLCPELPYIDNSPHGGMSCQSPVEGECHNWGNFYNSTKDPVFVTETCWTQESYSRPETLKKYMGMDVDNFSGPGWAAKWKERTGLDLFTKHPYSDWFEVKNLRLYLRSLEVEQMRADYSALGMFRFASPGNNGVIYWSFNKGGPLFQFGCVDYGGYPMMPYYAVKKIFSPLAVHARRDVADIPVMISNHGIEAVTADLEVFHLTKDGARLGYWSRRIRTEAGGLCEAFRLNDLYSEVNERTAEIIYVCASVNGKIAADDMLFFCPFMEYDGEYKPLKIRTEKSGDKWLIHLEAKTPVRMVELESSQKLLYSDDYFPLIPEKPKTIEAAILEKTSGGAVKLTVSVLGGEEKQDLVLR
jgi:beta-mannosidase